MRDLRYASLLGLLLVAPNAPADTNVPVFVNLVMHIEENAAYDTSLPLYTTLRHRLVDLSEVLLSHGVMFNFQSDWRFLAGVTNFDHGLMTTNTSGTNVVAYLSQCGFEIDPHAHETTRNYADVACLVQQCGVTPSGVAGGLIAHPPSNSILEQFWQPIAGMVYTDYLWQAEVLWGGGTGNHQDETNLWTSGVWMPESTNHYLRHDPAPPRIPALGNFGATQMAWTNLEWLMELRAAGLLSTSCFYSCAIMIRPGELTTNPVYLAELDARLQHYTSFTNVHWTGITESLDHWRNHFAERPSVLPFSFRGDVDEDTLADGWEVTNFYELVSSDGTGDADTDGLSDAEEQFAETSPVDDQDYFATSGEPDLYHARLVVTFGTLSNRAYVVQSCTNLPDQAWSNLHFVAGDGLEKTYLAPPAPITAFYRVGIR